MAIPLEPRAYGPDSTPEEITAIEERISIYEPGILYWRELTVQSEFHIEIFNRRLHELSQGRDYRLLIDLVEAKPPNAAVRAAVKRLFADQPKITRTAVFTEKNMMLSIAARLVMTNAGLRNFAVYKTRNEALEDLRGAKA